FFMNIPRALVDYGYLLSKPALFYLTKRDPETAHEIFIQIANLLHRRGLDKYLLEHSDCKPNPDIEFSNAAGFNKNGDISPSFLKYLGFDRVVVGTVTADSWEGNPRPRIKRELNTESMFNWMELPGLGAERVAENIGEYGNHRVPLTISVMSTPQKQGDGLLEDLATTTKRMRSVPYVDRFELNISCPNTEGDTRDRYLKELESMIDVINSIKLNNQALYIKLSPDMDDSALNHTFDVLFGTRVEGVVVSNTTTKASEKVLPFYDRGGISGEGVYRPSTEIQKKIYRKALSMDNHLEIIASGGIDTPHKVNERVFYGASGIQIYTPLIFKGPGLLRKLKRLVR
ncbi:MAG: hypothetical protein KJI69_06355, partial [Patescibacteria group bacterium]|nr:hypothetical protein [Patescibacteria group bacterium]